MSFRTYGELKEQVQEELDLVEETQIAEAEFVDFCNESVEEAESAINEICEDYFKTKATFDVTAGEAEYDLPEDIYADKVRAIIFNDGSTVYQVKKMKRSTMHEDMVFQDQSTSNQLMYDIVNYPTGRKIVFHPAPNFTDDTTLTIWYIRNAAQVAIDADVVDIPEFSRFIKQNMKLLCCEREGHPLLAYHEKKADKYRTRMITSLSNRTPDGDDVMEKDLSFYEEHN